MEDCIFDVLLNGNFLKVMVFRVRTIGLLNTFKIGFKPISYDNFRRFARSFLC